MLDYYFVVVLLEFTESFIEEFCSIHIEENIISFLFFVQVVFNFTMSL